MADDSNNPKGQSGTPNYQQLVDDLTQEMDLRETIEGDLVVIGKISRKLRLHVFNTYGVIL